MPTDIIAALGWLWLATICWRIDQPFREHLAFFRDWLPLVAALSVYDLTRGFADNGREPHLWEMVHFDQWLMGGDDLPTLWLQRHLYNPSSVQWWEILVSLIYFSHFVAAPVAAVVLWLRNRTEWARFVRRWIALSVAGLTTYIIFPATPPWLAGQNGDIDVVERLSTRGWHLLGMRTAGHLLNVAQQNLSNPVAAMPSLHSAFALLVVAFFLPKVRRRWWPLLLSYPLAMAAILVYSGEHWVLDAIVGFAYVGLIFLVMAWVESRWLTKRPSQLDHSDPDPDPDAVAPSGDTLEEAENAELVDAMGGESPQPVGGPARASTHTG